MPKTKEQLLTEVTDLIISSVNLAHRNRNEITADTPLMEQGLGLDSLDILEIVVTVEQKYGVKISGPEEGKTVFRTVGTLADYLHSKTA